MAAERSLGTCGANARLEIVQSLSLHKCLRQGAPVIYILSAGCQSHGNLGASRCFVDTLLAAAVLMEEGTDCLVQLVKRASLYFFSQLK